MNERIVYLVQGMGTGGVEHVVRRVALVVTQMTPGGKERVVMHLAAQLASRGIEPIVVCLMEKGEFGEQLEAQGVRVVALHSRRGWDLAAVWRLTRLFRLFRPDVINVHDRSSLPYVFLANMFGGRRAVVFTGHGLLLQEGTRARRAERWAMLGVRALTAVSEPAAREYASVLGWRGGVEVIPNGVDVVEMRSSWRGDVRRGLGLEDGDFVFLAVGNLNPEKGYEDLLVAASGLRVLQPARRIVTLVAGGKENKGYVESLCRLQRRRSLEGIVRFLGYRAEVRELHAAADAFVLPSRKEGLPMALLEAMGSGLPVVATRVGGVPTAIRHEEDGLLVQAQTPEEMAEAMNRLAIDGVLCRRLGANARRRMESEFSVRTMARKYLDVYASVMRRTH